MAVVPAPAVTIATAGAGTIAITAGITAVVNVAMAAALAASVGALGAGIIEAATDPNPFARPGQKKQEREKRNKNRKKPGFKDHGGKRRPKPPKSHTPCKGHRKYKLQSYENFSNLPIQGLQRLFTNTSVGNKNMTKQETPEFSSMTAKGSVKSYQVTKEKSSRRIGKGSRF